MWYFIPLAQSQSNLICNQLSSKHKEGNPKVVLHNVFEWDKMRYVAAVDSDIFYLIALSFNARSFAIAILVCFFFPFFFPSCHFFWMDASDQDLTHSLDTLKCLSVNIVPQVVICNTCGT